MFPWLPQAGGPLTGHGIVILIAALTTAGAYLVGRWLFDTRRPSRVHAPPDQGPSFLPLETAGATPDRRASPRRGGNAVQVLLRLDQDQDPSLGWVLNRSGGGLCVLSDRPMAVQAILQIRPDSDRAEGWTEAVVRSCRPEGEQYELGLQFLSKPSWGYMMQFG
jgi:hypothetical protein